MEQKRDYYDVLGLSRDAGRRDIKAAYRRLARRHHPDVNNDDPDAEERFKQIGEAYAVLSDPDRRARYDRFGHEAPGGFWPDMTDFDPFSIFDMFFGRRPGARTVVRGEDLGYDMAITLEDVFTGAERKIAMETKTVRIPPGIEDGQRMRYEGEGNAAPGGISGDLYVRVFVQPHEQFERRGADIVYEQKITVAQAALGHALEVPALGEPCELTISPGTQSGESFCLRGKGLPLLRGRGEGDHYVVVTVETPTNLTVREQELLTEFAALRGEELRPTGEGLLGRISRGRRRRKQRP